MPYEPPARPVRILRLDLVSDREAEALFPQGAAAIANQEMITIAITVMANAELKLITRRSTFNCLRFELCAEFLLHTAAAFAHYRPVCAHHYASQHVGDAGPTGVLCSTYQNY